MRNEERPPLTDSPWFWVLAFASMAMGALLAIGPKYGGRQARIERQYQARERILEERHPAPSVGRDAGNIEASRQRREGEGPRREFASSGELLVPLWPLAVILSFVILLSAIMLVRARGRAGPVAGENAS